MFRAQVLRRNLSLFTGVSSSRIARSAARSGHETVTVQRFRIRRPFVSRSRLVGIVALSWASYSLVQYLGLELEVQVVEKEQKPGRPADAINNENKPDQEWQTATGSDDDDEDGDDDDEYDDVLLFLPTGFSRPAPRVYYRGSDPEWQEFKKIATDSARVNKIRGQLVTLIRNTANTTAAFTKLVGKIDATKGKTWIDVEFPAAPPVEFERPGIELTHDLQWRTATRPVDFVDHQRLTRLLYPSAVGTAVYQDTKRKAEQSWRGLRAYLGWEKRPVQPEAFKDLMQQLSANVTPPTSPAAPSIVTSSTGAAPPPTPDGPAKDVGLAMPQAKDLTLDLTDFRKHLGKTLKPYSPQPPRGCFILLGLVEVYGDRARMTLQVHAIYDPKQAKYIHTNLKLFNLVPHRQQPRGGP